MNRSIKHLRYLYSLLLGVILLTSALHQAKAQAAEPYDLLIVTVDRFLNDAERLASWKRQLGLRTKVISQPVWADPQNSNIRSAYWGDPEPNLPYSRINLNTVRQTITPYITENGIRYLLFIGNPNDIMPITIGNVYTGQFGVDTSRKTDLYYATAGTINDADLMSFTPVGPGICHSGSYATNDCRQLILNINGAYEVVTEEESVRIYNSYSEYLDEVNSWHSGETQTETYHPDVAYGRISVDTPAELTEVVDKIIDFEQYPTTNAAYYENFIVAAQGVDEYMPTAKRVYWWLEDQGKSGTHFFSHNPGKVDEDGFEYRPITPDEIIDAIEDSAFFVMHRDHGETNRWKYPQFTTGDVANLQNDDLPFVFNMDCLTGSLEPISFNQKIVSHIDGGAIASLGASGVTDMMHNNFLAKAIAYTIVPGDFSGVTDMDLSPLDTGAPYRIGDIVNTAKTIMELSEDLISTSNRMFGMTYFERYNLAGDPTVAVLTSVPQTLSASYPTSLPLGTSTLDVTAINAPSGSITLVDANGNLVALKDFTGDSATLTFAPVDTDLTLTLTISSYGYIPLVDDIDFTGQVDFNFIASPNPVPNGVPVYISYTIPAAYDGAEIRIIEHREWNDEIRCDYNQVAFSGSMGTHQYGPIWFFNKWYFGTTSGPYTLDLEVDGTVVDSLDLTFSY